MSPIPLPYAGSYYPIYNAGPRQWIPPTPSMPFDRVSALFIAFAHAYPDPDNPNGTLLALEQGQPEEPERVPQLTATARQVNPGIKILISLGWSAEGSDWVNINRDAHGANEFPASVVALIRQYGLDGFDIDDESVSGIDQATFDGVMQNLRNALDAASSEDGKPYYLTITPAFGTAEVTAQNRAYFDLINMQTYSGVPFTQQFVDIGCPLSQLAWGINSELGESAPYPAQAEYEDLAGIFDWSMSADSDLGFYFTNRIAADVGYQGGG